MGNGARGACVDTRPRALGCGRHRKPAMTYTLDMPMIIAATVAFLVGVIIGFALRGGARHRAQLAEERLSALASDHNALLAERDALRLERDSLDQRLTPLAAEVDRYKRVETRRGVAVDTPVETVAVAPTATTPDSPDVRRLKGVGDRFAAALANAGVTRIDQIAAWSSTDADAIDAQLGSFAGRVRTDRLVEQARLLHEGRTTEYETRFGAI